MQAAQELQAARRVERLEAEQKIEQEIAGAFGAEDRRRPAGARRRERTEAAASAACACCAKWSAHAGYQQAVKQEFCCTRAGTRAFAAWWRR